MEMEEGRGVGGVERNNSLHVNFTPLSASRVLHLRQRHLPEGSSLVAVQVLCDLERNASIGAIS